MWTDVNNTGQLCGGGVVWENKKLENHYVDNDRIKIYLKWTNKVTPLVVVVRLIHYCFIAVVTVILCDVVEVTPT